MEVWSFQTLSIQIIKCADFKNHHISILYVLSEPASPGPDSDTTMEVDSSDVNSDSSRGLDDSEEPTTPEDKIFFMDSPFMDREKDEEPVKTIRYML